jgi:hypothetical protein
MENNMLSATLAVVILGLAAYIGVLLNQRKELRSRIHAAETMVQRHTLEHDRLTERVLLLEKDLPWYEKTIIRTGWIQPTEPKHIVSLPPEDVYLCARPLTCKCRDRVKQGAEGPALVQQFRDLDRGSIDLADAEPKLSVALGMDTPRLQPTKLT